MTNFSVWSLSRLEPPFCLEPEPDPTQFGRSRSRLQDHGLPELEQPKKVAAPQHWYVG